MGPKASCVLLAASHHGLAEGVRSLLGTEFDSVVMVADARSLHESSPRLHPALVVVDVEFAHGDLCELLRRLQAGSPGLKVILLSAHSGPTVARAAMEAGAQGLVSRHEIATDLLVAVDAVRRGERHFPSEASGGTSREE